MRSEASVFPWQELGLAEVEAVLDAFERKRLFPPAGYQVTSPAPSSGGTGLAGGLSGLVGRVRAVAAREFPSGMLRSSRREVVLRDVLALSPDEQADWVTELEDGIARGELASWLEAVFWAAPELQLPGALRLRLVAGLYHRAATSVEVQRLALTLALAEREPEAVIRQASLRFLLTHLRILPAERVLEVAEVAGCPEREPVEAVRRVAQEILRRLFPNLPAARQAVYRLVWQRDEPSAVCRRKLLETLLRWLPEADATGRERLEGLYLLSRAVGDEREALEVREALARPLLSLDLSFFPASIEQYIRQHIHPVCRRVVGG